MEGLKLGEKRLLETLEKLETDAKKFNEFMTKRELADANKKRIRDLHRKVEELERRKSELIRQSSITTVAGKVISSGSDTRDAHVDGSGFSALPTPEEVKQMDEERKHEAFLQAYRLTGISIVKYENRTMLIELSTSYEGRYYEAYYIELTDHGDDGKTLSHHTIPYFIPVMSSFDSYLAGKLHFHGFLLPVLNGLNGFVSRRQQAMQADTVLKKYLQESVVATMSYDLIQLVTKDINAVEKKMGFRYVVRLLYDNQFAARPTKVRCRVTFLGNCEETDIVKDIKSCYKSYDITEAFMKVIENVCEGSQISVTTSFSTSSSSNDTNNKTVETTQT